MTITIQHSGRTILSLAAALVISAAFVAAATGPALVTPASNNVIMA